MPIVTRRAQPVLAVAIAGLCMVAAPWGAAAATSSPSDPLFGDGSQWALTGAAASIAAPPAWCAGTGSGVLVADVDTGVDFGHPDLAGKLVAGARFTNGDGNPSGSGQAAVQDDNGHGTMTSGIVAANTNNGRGIAAVAPGARVLAVKVLTDAGDGSGRASGYDNDVAAGIKYAVNAGARVINLSIGPDVPLTGASLVSSIPAAIQYAWNHNVIVAVAAGNSSLPTSSYPDVAPYSLVVGALGRDAVPAYYSNSLVGVNIYAPGGDSTGGNDSRHLVISTFRGGGYVAEQGTSFAAPQAAGVLALLIGRGYSAAGARQAVLGSAVSRNGHPDLDAAAALGVAPTASCGGQPATGAPPARAGSTARAGAATPAAVAGATPAVTPGGSPSSSTTPGQGLAAQANGAAGPGATPGVATTGSRGGWAPLVAVLVVVAVGVSAGAYLRRRRT
jgi:thermitase